MSTLFSWVGTTDLRASTGNEEAGLGPIGQAVMAMPFDRLELLTDQKKEDVERYTSWLGGRFSGSITVHPVSLERPTDFSAIYLHASRTVEKVREESGAADGSFTYHLSPGTPAMAAVWIIMAKTKYPATLIESSREHGVATVSVPFALEAEFTPESPSFAEELRSLAIAEAPRDAHFDSIVHGCEAMRRAVQEARLYAKFDVPVLLLGETGTGKELFARAVHRASPRSEKPFLAVNCGAIPASLVEGELFGSVKGAFTGATADRPGVFDAANGGSLFLDEVGELPLEVQVKLLRVLQDGSFSAVGSRVEKKVDVRIIAATNRDLPRDIRNGSFREDLFHRLAVGVVRLPPLRDRGEDLSLLTDHIMGVINATFSAHAGWKPKSVSLSGKRFIRSCPWPGNFRELQNTLTRAALGSHGESIGEEDIRGALLSGISGQAGGERILDLPMGDGFSLPALLDRVTRHYLERAVRDSSGVKKEGADLLGFDNYQTYTNWLRRYGYETREGEA